MFSTEFDIVNTTVKLVFECQKLNISFEVVQDVHKLGHILLTFNGEERVFLSVHSALNFVEGYSAGAK